MANISRLEQDNVDQKTALQTAIYNSTNSTKTLQAYHIWRTWSTNGENGTGVSILPKSTFSDVHIACPMRYMN